MLAEAEIEPVDELPDADELAETGDGAARRARPRRRPQAQRRPGDEHGHDQGQVAARGQGRAERSWTSSPARCSACARRTGARLPLVLMNSFATRDDSLAALERHPELAVATCPPDFVQNKVPKLHADGLDAGRLARRTRPRMGAARPRRPVHGAASPRACSTRCSSSGYRYAFVSNADNLGAVLDPRILAWVAREQIPFLMEVADRTPADRKGGHLARRPRRRARPARDRPDAGRGRRRLPGHRAPPLLQHQHAVGRPARAARDAASATACSGCR